MSETMIDVATTEPGSAAWWAAHAERLARRRPRSGGLTIERIVEAAVEIIDAHGLEALTVRNLAARFETSSATLYRHVASVEDLRVLVIDRVLGEVELPEPELPARDKVTWLAVELRRVLVAHSEVVPALRAAPLLGPNAQRGAEAGFRCLLEMGFPEEIAVPAYLALIDFVLGSVFFDSASGSHGTASGSHGTASGSHGTASGSHGTASGSHSTAEPGRAAALTGDDVVRFGLDVFLTGLTSVTAPTSS